MMLLRSRPVSGEAPSRTQLAFCSQWRSSDYKQSIQMKRNSQLDEAKLKARQELRQKQEDLHLKELEFNVVDNLNMKEINEMLLTQNGFVFENIKEFYDDHKAQEKEIYVDPKSLDPRRPRVDQYCDKYLAAKPNIYGKIGASEMKELVEQFQQNKRLTAQKLHEGSAALNTRYTIDYSAFLQRQPEVEFNRRQLLQDLGEVHELLSVMHNTPTFEKPTIWNVKPLNEQEREMVEGQVKEKIQTVERRFEFENYQPEEQREDILREVREYLNKQYFQNNPPQ